MMTTETPCPKRPNRRLRLARERRGWTQEELAERIGASPLSVGRWERGSVTPGPHYRRTLCEVFQQSIEDLGLLDPQPEELPASQEAQTGEHKPAAITNRDAAAPGQPSASLQPVPVASGPLTAPGVARGEPAQDAGEANTNPESAAVAPTWAPIYHGAPAPLTSSAVVGLVGRDADLRRLSALLADERRLALLALYGLPGVGKTALAAALVRSPAIRAEFADGALWAGLGQAPDALSELAGWGAALGMNATDLARYGSLDALGKAVRAAIGERRLLLVIDDAWALADALALRVGGPNCAHLVTTRFPTVAWQFAPTGTQALGELAEDEAVALLAALAPAAIAAEPKEARELARSVGGLPLALTLMGSYLQTQAQSGQPRRLRAALASLRHIAQRMELATPYAPVDAPTGLPSGAQQSLHATLALSESALSEEARQLWRALACLPAKPSGFAEGAALAIGAQPVSVLDELSDAGLLESVGPGRYTLHQTVHDYARYASAAADAERRMADYYLAHVETYSHDYAALEPDAENIVAALQIAEQHKLVALVARGGVAFAPFLEARGLYAQAERYLTSAQAAADSLGDAHARTGALLGLARIANRRGLVAEAERLYAMGLVCAEDAGETRLSYMLLIGWGEAAMGSGDFARAETYLRRALAVARAAGDHRRTGETLRLLGEIADAGGHFTQGDTLYYEGLALARQSHDTETVCMLLQNIGGKAVLRGDYSTGEALLREGLALARSMGHRQRGERVVEQPGRRGATPGAAARGRAPVWREPSAGPRHRPAHADDHGA